jgi:hypothetical protein
MLWMTIMSLHPPEHIGVISTITFWSSLWTSQTLLVAVTISPALLDVH